jgi:hypothetical protein
MARHQVPIKITCGGNLTQQQQDVVRRLEQALITIQRALPQSTPEIVDDLTSKFGVRMAAVRGVLAVIGLISLVGFVSALAGYLSA